MTQLHKIKIEDNGTFEGIQLRTLMKFLNGHRQCLQSGKIVLRVKGRWLYVYNRTKYIKPRIYNAERVHEEISVTIMIEQFEA